jgi:uncharacterized membrane protein YqjE
VKSVSEVIADLKSELVEFFSTRVAMLIAELRENVQSLKMAMPMLAGGLALAWTAWLAFTAFLVMIIGAAFGPRAWAYPVASLIVAVLYFIFGGMMLMAGWRQLLKKSLKPERTIRVLQQDKIWIQEESRAQL